MSSNRAEIKNDANGIIVNTISVAKYNACGKYTDAKHHDWQMPHDAIHNLGA